MATTAMPSAKSVEFWKKRNMPTAVTPAHCQNRARSAGSNGKKDALGFELSEDGLLMVLSMQFAAPAIRVTRTDRKCDTN
jgi:hypothetical protein